MANKDPLPLIPWHKSHISTERNSKDVTHVVLNTAIDIFILGFPSQANRLITSLYTAGNGIQIETVCVLPLYLAWEATSSKPTCIANPDPDKIFDGIEDNEEGKKKLENLKKNFASKWPRKLKENLPDLGAGDLEYALEHLDNIAKNPYHEDSMTAGIAIEVAIRVGDEGKAKELVEKNVAGIYRELQDLWDDGETTASDVRSRVNDRLGIQHCIRIWESLKDGAVGKALDIDETTLSAFVDEGCEIINERFTNGPKSAYADKTMAELVQILNESYIAARKANPQAGEHMSILNGDGANEIPDSFLQPPATDDEISELEKNLSLPEENDGDADDDDENNNDENNNDEKDDDEATPKSPAKNPQTPIKLPTAYTQFLQTTNGFYVSDPSDQTSIFYGTLGVTRENSDFLSDMELELFPYQFTDVNFDNIEFSSYVRAFSVGAGGDEGGIWMIEPASVSSILAKFEETYKQASEKEKRMYERAALDIYGGIEKLRRCEWLMLVTYHWDVYQYMYGGFAEYLEVEAVPYAVRRRAQDEREGTARKRKRGGGEGNENDDEDEEGDISGGDVSAEDFNNDGEDDAAEESGEDASESDDRGEGNLPGNKRHKSEK